MAVPVDAEESLAAKFAALFPHLDERQRRLVMGAEARVLGHGGIKVVAAAADVSAVTVLRGVAELEGGGEPLGRARRPGGGRRRVAGTDPGLKDALLALVDPESRGDPESPLRWTTKLTRHLAAALTAAGHPVSAPTVAALLKEESFSLQGNVKTLEGARHADRDAQFRYINAQARDHMDAGDPVISVDAKKKENVGPFKKGGAEWQPKGAPEPVNVHDFIDKELGKVTPYGVYDVAGNAGWVSVGTDHDTAAFAVATIRTWWDKAGQAAYPDARRLLITADGGGSNGYRTRLWKTELAAFAAETGLQITVCHLPPGTSKWNKIEHRLFSHISMNWRGLPLTSHEVIVNTIAATTTRTGLTVSAELDTGDYPKGIKISDREIQNLEKQNVLRRHDFHGEWNYCLDPPPPPPETSVLFICGHLVMSMRKKPLGTSRLPDLRSRCSDAGAATPTDTISPRLTRCATCSASRSAGLPGSLTRPPSAVTPARRICTTCASSCATCHALGVCDANATRSPSVAARASSAFNSAARPKWACTREKSWLNNSSISALCGTGRATPVVAACQDSRNEIGTGLKARTRSPTSISGSTRCPAGELMGEFERTGIRLKS